MDTNYVNPTGTIIRVAAGGNLQVALNTAQPGGRITLEKGAVFAGNFTLPAKGGAGYVFVETENFAIPVGQRLVPNGGMAALVSPNTVPVLQTLSGAHHFRFVGIDAKAPGLSIDTLIQLGDGSEILANQPHHIIFDRCFIHGDPNLGGKRGVSFQGRHLAIIDSVLSDWKRLGQDTQAICGWNGAGPFKIVNNLIEGAGENVMFGGADAAVLNLVPSDIEIRGNHFFKPLSWKIGHPSYAGTPWLVKNLFELKNARRVLVENNLFENNWAHGQPGFAIVFTPRNSSGTNPWTTLEDVIFQKNELRNSANGFNIMGQDFESGVPSQISKRLKIAQNIGQDIGHTPYVDGILFQILSGYEDVNINHNTFLHSGTTIVADGAPSPRLRFTNNIAQHNAYGIFGSGAGVGNSAIAAFFPNSVFAKNVLATPVEPVSTSSYPPANYFPGTLQEIGFVDLAAGDLGLTAASPYHNAATDGTDIGANLVPMP